MVGYCLYGRGLGTKCEPHLLPQCIIGIRCLAGILAAESIGCVQKLKDEALVFLGAISTVICKNQVSELKWCSLTARLIVHLEHSAPGPCLESKPQSVHGAENCRKQLAASHVLAMYTMLLNFTGRACLVSTSARSLCSPVHQPAGSSAARLCSLQWLPLAQPTPSGAAVSDLWQPAHGLQLCSPLESRALQPDCACILRYSGHCYSCMPQASCTW